MNSMKILVFSDLHGDDLLISKVKELSKNVDLAICCGDITPIHGDTSNAARKIGRLDTNLLIIPGNFELPNILDEVCREHGWINIHGKAFEMGDLVIAGCGGACIGPFNTPYEISEDEFKAILSRIEPIPNILVSHTPPFGSTDEVRGKNIGSRVLREYIEENRPKLNLCGHVHENGGKEVMISNTRVMNVAREVRVIDISPHEVRRVP